MKVFYVGSRKCLLDPDLDAALSLRRLPAESVRLYEEGRTNDAQV